MALIDLPATMDYVLRETGYTNVSFALKERSCRHVSCVVQGSGYSGMHNMLQKDDRYASVVLCCRVAEKNINFIVLSV